mmetsp:Transcript_1607/g.3771  ORF Transcript_1607/g.3771 Transcript_1607/m.3771 type:complete len:283 (-) Transcript_1607:507-1355(-)|eukprot:g17720.t1
MREALQWARQGEEAELEGIELIDLLTKKYVDQDFKECKCGYYEMWHGVFLANGYENIDKTLARVLVEGRGDRYSALVFVGPAGSGKTHLIISPLVEILKEKSSILPSGEGSYLLSSVLERSCKCFILDEVTLPRLQSLFGSPSMKGWFKALLHFLTARSLDIPVPKNQTKFDSTWWESGAPMIGTTTHPLQLEDGMGDGIADDDIEQEQAQLGQRVTYIKLRSNIKKAIAKQKPGWEDIVPAKVCSCCFSRICYEGKQKYLKDPVDIYKGPMIAPVKKEQAE